MPLPYSIILIGISGGDAWDFKTQAFVYFVILVGTSVLFTFILKGIYGLLIEQLQHPAMARRYEYFKRFVEPETLVRYQLLWACGSAVAGCALVLFLGIVHPLALMGTAMFFIALGVLLPYGYYWLRFKRRQMAIEDKFMDFLIALVDTLKAGQAMTQALKGITAQSSGPIQEEFQQVLNDQSLGLPLQEAVTRLAARNPFEDMKLFAITVNLTTDSGGRQVEVLNELVETIRERRKFAQDLRTLTSNGRMEAKVLSCAPLAFLLLLSLVARSMMKAMWTTTGGWVCIGVIVLLVTLASLWLHKIVSIDV